MLEGVMLSAIAGVVGIAIGVVAAPRLTSLLQITPTISRAAGFGAVGAAASSVAVSPELILIGLGVAILLGTLRQSVSCLESSKNKTCGGNEI